MKRIVMLLFLSVMVCTLSAQEKKGETIGERIVANAYNADSIRGILDLSLIHISEPTRH